MKPKAFRKFRASAMSWVEVKATHESETWTRGLFTSPLTRHMSESAL